MALKLYRSHQRPPPTSKVLSPTCCRPKLPFAGPPNAKPRLVDGRLGAAGIAPKDRALVVVPEDADTVRSIFKRYRELGSVDQLAKELNAKGITTKRRISKCGIESGGAAYFQGAIYHLLKNQIYIGEIRHKGSVYPGQHQAIIDREIWDQAQQCLRTGCHQG